MSIKVLHIINSLGLGGAQVCLKDIVENINPEQINCIIYPLRPLKEISINGEIINKSRSNYSLFKLLDIIKICRSNNINIIHTHLHKSAIIAILASFFCKAKVIVHEHGQVIESHWQFKLYRILLKLLAHKVNHFIAVSNYIKETLIHSCSINEKKVTVVYNAVDLGKFQYSQEARTKLRQSLGINDTELVIGYTGRINHAKGSDYLPSILNYLHKNGHKAHMIVAGRGPLYEQVQTEAKEMGLAKYLHLLGFRNDIHTVISSFDLAIHPARQEPFGISIIEYFSAKIPVVCGNVNGLNEIAINNQTAITVKQPSPQEFANNIINLISDNKLRHNLIQNAYNSCQQFSIKNQLNQISDIYIRNN